MKSPIHGVPIEQIVLVDRLTRRQKDFAHATSALPGHLIQLTTQGTAEYESEGQVFRLEPGVIVWFHDDQDVLVRVTQAPWSFLTVNFIMPHLPPPPFDQRIRRADTETRTLFERLFDAWRTNDATPPLARTIRVQAKLLDLIANILPAHTATFHLDRDAQIWWALEAQLRAHLDETVNLATLSKMSGRSARTLHRACHRATGLPPLQRLKKIRLSMARGLILYSPLTISEIATRTGYERVQEMCRDYRLHFKLTPTQDRNAGPDYRRPRRRVQA